MNLFSKLDVNKKNFETIRLSLLWTRYERNGEIGVVSEISKNDRVKLTFKNESGKIYVDTLTWEEASALKRVTTDSLIEMIVAIGQNNEIGKDNKLLWDIPEDMDHFKNVTMGKTIIMGRNTYESIGRPLPGRKNVILTSDPSKFNDERLSFISSLEEGLELAKVEEVVIIGGDSVYKQFLPYCDILHITEIDKDFEGDTFFPVIDETIWSRKLSVDGKESGKNGIEYSFNIYEKKF